VWGDIHNTVLSFQLREEFQYCSIVSGYIPEDSESCGYAALIVWLNPRYNEKKPSLLAPSHIPQGEI
jgi:hypothetical protein